MTAARRALPQPTRLQRVAARLTSAQRYEALTNAIEDHADRLDSQARRAESLGQHYLAGAHRKTAAQLRQLLDTH